MSSSERIAKNTFFLYIRLFFTLSVSLYTSRSILKILHVEDYGIYSIVGGVIALFGFFNSAMSTATYRFLAFDIGKKDKDQLKKTFNTTFIIHIGISLLVLLLSETLGVWYINNYLNVPKEKLGLTHWVYQFSIFTSLIGIMQVPFNALIIARERMNVYAIFSIVDSILKLFAVFLLFIIDYDKLILYAILVFFFSIVLAIGYRVYCYKNFEESIFELYLDKDYYNKLISFSGWNLFGNIAAVAKGQGVNLLLNVFFGTIVNAAYGITMQVQFAVAIFVVNFQTALNPQITKNYSQGNLVQTNNLIFKGSKYSFFLMLLLASPFFLNKQYILDLWLGYTPAHTVTFVQLAIIGTLIDAVSGPLIVGAQATGKIKWYQIILGSVLFLNLPISYIVLKLGATPESVFIVSIIVSILCLVFRIFFLRKLLNLDVYAFFTEVILKIVLVLMILIPFFMFTKTPVISIKDILLQTFLNSLVTVIVVFIIGIDKSERNALYAMLNKMVLFFKTGEK